MAGAEMGDWETVGGLELDKCIRHEVFRGCELAKQLETKLNSAEGSDLHQLVAQFSTQIVDTFGKALDFLNSDGNPNSASWREDLSNLPEKQIAGGVPGRGRPKGTPVKDIKNNSPCSGGRSSVSGSPPSDMSEGSPACNMVISPKLKRAEPAESSENEPGSFKERRDISRKRKLLPKRIERRPANTSEQGNDIPPDDGFTWRKYGQKDILGARYPRSYYRCTHKNDMGCQATKQVQRADDDSSFYDITYRGRHTCRVDRPLLQIELPFSIAQIGSNADSNSSLPNTLVFGTGYSLQSNTSTGHGLLPTQFNSSSREASGPCFGMNSVGCKNENLDDFRQSPVSPLLSSWTTLPQDHPNEGMQSIRPGKTCVSSFRRPSNEGENFIDFIPSHPNECAAFSEGELGMGNFDQIFGSPATTQSSYIPLAPTMPLLNPMESVPGQLVQTSESDLTEVVSGHTSAANSPMLDMDLMFNTNCSELQL